MTPPLPQSEIAHIDAQYAEIKTLIAEIGDRVRGLEMREASCNPVMTTQMAAAFRKLDDHEARIKVMETSITQKAAKADIDADLKVRRDKVNEELQAIRETLTELKNTNKILSWLGGTVGVAVILYIVNGILHLL